MKIRVGWTEVSSYERIVEIDDADWAEARENENEENELIDEAVATLDKADSIFLNFDREIDYFEMVE